MATIAIDARIINSTTGRYVERLLTYLETLDVVNEYVVIVPSKDRDYWKPKSKNFRVVTVDYKNYSFGEQLGYCRFLYSLKADLVHFCMPQQPIFYSRPHVTTVHDLTLLKTYNSDKNWFIYKSKQLVGRVVFYVIARTSQQIITDTRYTQKAYAEFANIPENRISPILLGADQLTIEPKQYSGLEPNEKFLLYVGQQSDYKNIRRLIAAHQSLLAVHPDLKLILVGKKGVLGERNEKWVQDNSYKNVVFTGFVDDNELSWLYNNCAAYVFPSLMEGFGLPGLEAMHYGAPVISSNATCLPEVYGDAAMYFDPTNTNDMAEKINTVLSDDTIRNELIEKGHLQVNKYSWERTAQQTLQVYRNALGN